MAKATSSEKILKAATQLFAYRGYDATTTKQIARAAGVNEATLFRTFGGKKRLFRTVTERMIQATTPDFAPVFNATEPADFARLLSMAMYPILTPVQVRLGIANTQSLSEKQLIAYSRENAFPYYQAVTNKIEEFQRAGKVRADVDPRSAAIAITILHYGKALIEALFGAAWAKEAGFKPIDIERFADIWAHGVVPRGK